MCAPCAGAGVIPGELAGLARLSDLNLSANQLQGKIQPRLFCVRLFVYGMRLATAKYRCDLEPSGYLLLLVGSLRVLRELLVREGKLKQVFFAYGKSPTG